MKMTLSFIFDPKAKYFMLILYHHHICKVFLGSSKNSVWIYIQKHNATVELFHPQVSKLGTYFTLLVFLRFLVLDVFTFLYFYHGFMLTVTKSTDHVCSASYVFLFFLSQFFWFVNNSGLSKSRCIRLFELVCEAGLSSKFWIYYLISK